jgi:hypothetical protein
MKISRIVLLVASFQCVEAEHNDVLGTLQARICIHLTDEDGASLKRTRCGAGLLLPGKTWDSYEHKAVYGLTDERGEFCAEGRTMNSLGVGAQPEGYYMSSRSIFLNDGRNGKWMPFPRFETLIMKRILKPVRMYALANWPIVLPARSGSFGFDLEKRDWVPPHGAGVKADFVFTQQVKQDNVLGSAATLRVSFSNPGDGLIPFYELPGAESELKLPRTAPNEGYEAERKFSAEWSPSRDATPAVKPALGYIYRVRTVLDASGQVKSAWYGKMEGEFD